MSANRYACAAAALCGAAFGLFAANVSRGVGGGGCPTTATIRAVQQQQQQQQLSISNARGGRPLPSWVTEHLATLDENTRARCSSVMARDDHAWSQAGQDHYAFENWLWDLPGPGVFLDLGANDPFELSNTAFFEICLGWRGVAVEPNPKYFDAYAAWRPRTRLVRNCVGTRENEDVAFVFDDAAGAIDESGGSTTHATCKTLRQILEENADVLGGPDDTGAFATRVNFVSVDVEGFEANVLGCSDLGGLFSRRPLRQVWTVETARASAPQLNTIYAAMGLAGYVAASPVVQFDGTFVDSVFVLAPGVYTKTLAQHACRTSGTETCALADVMSPFDATTQLHGHAARC